MTGRTYRMISANLLDPTVANINTLVICLHAIHRYISIRRQAQERLEEMKERT